MGLSGNNSCLESNRLAEAAGSTQKRQDILEAALREFETRGFGETSMDRIAQSAKVSKRTVYNHFASKDALFDAIADELSRRVEQVTDYPFNPDDPIDQQLHAIGGQLMDMLGAPCFVTMAKVAMVEMIRSPELAQRTYGLFRERQKGLARWLIDAAASGQLDIDDGVRAADQFLGLIKSFSFWPQILGDQPVPDAEERERILDSSVTLFLAHYAGKD